MHALEALQDQTRAALRRVIPPRSDVALLDFPRHHNAGDALIWLGTLSYLADLEVNVRLLAGRQYFDAAELRTVMPEGTVLIQGGGNFGDKWPGSHDFRLRVIEALPDYRVVQLPQGLDFTTADSAGPTARVLARHPDMTLFVRDHAGVAQARRVFPDTPVLFAPDLALGVGPLRRTAPAAVPVLMLLRDDHERLPGTGRVAELEGAEVRDWGLSGADAVWWRVLRAPEDVARVSGRPGRVLRPLISRSFAAMARLNVATARDILSRGEVVVTDRLHAMVLAALCGIPVVALDNSNGKVGAVHRDYLHTLPMTFMADDPRHARELALSIAR